MNDFLNEIHQIACLKPSIVERVDVDLDLHAKKKKLLRLSDAQFLAGPLFSKKNHTPRSLL
jgi:hypothetical protein